MWILFVCLNNNPVLSAFMSDHWVCDTSNKRDVASKAGTIYTSGSPSSFYKIRIAQSLACCVVFYKIRVITKLPNTEQSYKGKVKTHNYINRQIQSTTGKL